MSLIGLKDRAVKEGWAKYIRSEADERAMLNGCYFDMRKAMHVVEFFPKFLRHSKGKWGGKPFELDTWQREDVMMPIFGWQQASGTRRFTQAYLEEPKKTGKSTMSAGVGLYMTCGDGEPGAEVFSAATDRKQAGIVHNEAINMVDASPELSAALRINRSTHRISYPESKAWYEALAGAIGPNDGLNGHCCIIDEFHEWKGRGMWDTLRYMFAAREQPLLWIITTAGEDFLSVCYELHEKALKILSGEWFDERFFAHVSAADEKDDWQAEETWIKANPGWHTTINQREFRANAEDAAKTPAAVSNFKRKHLNIWCTGSNTWFEPGIWSSAKVDVTLEDFAGQPCWGGLDLAKVSDTTALCLSFERNGMQFRGEEQPPLPLKILDDDGTEVDYVSEEIVQFYWFWLPEATAHKLAKRVPYEEWEKQGLIELTPGEVCDYRFIIRRVAALAKQFQIHSINYDPANASHLVQDLEALGIEMVEVNQGMGSMGPLSVDFERLVRSRRCRHNGHAVMDWQMGNAVVTKEDAKGLYKPIKPTPHDIRKIDGVHAAIMSAAGLMEGRGESDWAYNSHGLRYADEVF